MQIQRRMRMAVSGLLVALTFLIGFGLSATPPTVQAHAETVAVNPYIESKYILAQTSIDGPALWTSPTGTIRGEIAYTGTDAAHHLNVMTSTDGIHYSGKYILNETSFVRPAMVRFGSNDTDNIALAWTGDDANHSLNVIVGRPGFGYTKMTLRQQNSFTPPAIALKGSDLYLAWAGTDVNHSLNIAHIIWRGGMYMESKTTLWDLHSNGRPNLTYDPNSDRLLLSWGLSGSNKIAFATSSDGVHFTAPSSSPIAEWTRNGPSMVGLPVNNMPRYFLAWTGTDASHTLNAQFTESYPSWGDTAATKSTFWGDWAVGGPSLGYIGAFNRVLMAWTGTDASHHLNLAVVAVGHA